MWLAQQVAHAARNSRGAGVLQLHHHILSANNNSSRAYAASAEAVGASAAAGKLQVIAATSAHDHSSVYPFNIECCCSPR